MRSCPVCGGGDSEVFLERRGVPVHQNLLFRTPEEAAQAARGDLVMAICLTCEFIFNSAFDPELLQYGADYENDQTHSPAFDAHVDALVRMLVETRGVRDSEIVEVGCGNGYFLRRLVSWPASGNTGIGYDPSYRGPSTELDGRLRFERRSYGNGETGVRPNVVLSRHVIEHIAEPRRLMEAIRSAIGGSHEVRLFLETPSVGWILRNRVIWDFFYEHCSLFDHGSMARLLNKAGFEVLSLETIFNEQYLWVEARPGNETYVASGSLLQLARDFGSSQQQEVKKWRDKVASLAAKGKVALWGAGAKGVTFAGLIDGGRELIDCLIDINPEKQGRYVPLSAHPIVDVRTAHERGVRHAVLMNPNYELETLGMIADAQAHFELIT